MIYARQEDAFWKFQGAFFRLFTAGTYLPAYFMGKEGSGMGRSP